MFPNEETQQNLQNMHALLQTSLTFFQFSILAQNQMKTILKGFVESNPTAKLSSASITVRSVLMEEGFETLCTGKIVNICGRYLADK
jgi:hypothetical protein